jgi:hypothetical protein
MEFRTKRVVATARKKATLSYIGFVLAVCSILPISLPEWRLVGTIVFIAGILLVLAGAFIAKGNISIVGLSGDDLVVTPEKICLGKEEYPMQKVKELDFDVNGFNGMQDPYSSYKLDGMGNQIKFLYEGSTVKSQFYLNSQEHVRQLGELFKSFYEQHVPFVERTGRTRTYLFRDLDEAGLAEFKKKYGYT